VHRYGPRVGITSDRLERAHQFFLHRGRWSLPIGYFIPGVRHFVAVFAGTALLEWPVFALFAYGGALMWVSVFMGLGYFLSHQWLLVARTLHGWIEPLVLAGIVVAAVVWRLRSR
jgi:membrane protein DedA with SNARE-associated domain